MVQKEQVGAFQPVGVFNSVFSYWKLSNSYGKLGDIFRFF